MKKKVVFIAALVLCLAFVPCFAGGGGQQQSGPQKLVIAARGGLHVTAIESVKAAFESANNCVVEVLGLEAGDLKQKISLDSRSSAGIYDLAMADDPWMPEFCDAGIYADLSLLGLKDDPDFIPASLAIGKNPYGTGSIFALPFAGNVQLMFYNKALFDSNNIALPTDWAGVLAAAETLKRAGKLGYIIRGQQGNPIVSDYLPLLWAYGGNVFDSAGTITVDSQIAKDALRMYINLLGTGANYEQNDLVSSVADGNAGMALGWPSWFISGAKTNAAWAVIPGKAASNASAHPTGMIGHWMMGVTANSTKKDLALKLLQHLTSSESQKIMADNGGVPTRRSVYSDAALAAKYTYYPALLQATIDSVVRPRLVQWSEIETVYGAELSAAVSGAKTIDRALADAKTAIERVVR